MFSEQKKIGPFMFFNGSKGAYIFLFTEHVESNGMRLIFDGSLVSTHYFNTFDIKSMKLEIGRDKKVR